MSCVPYGYLCSYLIGSTPSLAVLAAVLKGVSLFIPCIILCGMFMVYRMWLKHYARKLITLQSNKFLSPYMTQNIFQDNKEKVYYLREFTRWKITECGAQHWPICIQIAILLWQFKSPVVFSIFCVPRWSSDPRTFPSWYVTKKQNLKRNRYSKHVCKAKRFNPQPYM